MMALQLRLALARFGWLNTFAVTLLAASVIGGGWTLAYLKSQVNAPVRSLRQAEQALKETLKDPAASARSQPEERLAAFYDTLGDKRYAEQQLKTLFAIAGKTGLALNQAEYRALSDKTSRITAYQITLPVKGSYEAIRQFCEQSLLAIPFASLDEIGFKRDAIGNNTLEAKLRIVLYLTEGKAGPPPAMQTAAEKAADNAITP
jgi:hypothetical protein